MAEYNIPNAEETAEPTKRRGGRKSAAQKAAEAEAAAMKAAETGDAGNTPVPADAAQEGAEPKKRGGRKPKETTPPPPPKPESAVRRAAWSDANITRQNPDVIKHFMYVECELLDEALGMMPNREDLMDKFLASQAPDAPTRAEEIEAAGAEAVSEDQMTIWPKSLFQWKTEDGIPRCLFDKTFSGNMTPEDLQALDEGEVASIQFPFVYDYQIRGMFKDSCGLLSRAKNNESAELKAFKKIIDGNIFVWPRHIALQVPDSYIDINGNTMSTYDQNGRLRTKQRAIRTNGPQGERNAIAKSEKIPAGTKFFFRIGYTNPTYRKAIEEWLDYGMVRGLGQWRNSGIGIFRWREVDENFQPFPEA